MSLKTPAGLRINRITPLAMMQDLGRYGYRDRGVSSSGAMDPLYLRIANILAGNPENTACLEFNIAGADFTITAPKLRVAFCGDFELLVNGREQAPFSVFHLCCGDNLEIRGPRQDIRGYLAVTGGYATTAELGSCATHYRSGLGVRAFNYTIGSVIGVRKNDCAVGKDRYLSPALLPSTLRDSGNNIATSNTIRVLPGPQSDLFCSATLKNFYSLGFAVSNQSDRMGYRLLGDFLAPGNHHQIDSIISEPVACGSIQVPSSGQAIALMADTPTTGGYPKIATIASTDIAVLAQKAPGTNLRFQKITLPEAQQLLHQQQAYLDAVRAAV